MQIKNRVLNRTTVGPLTTASAEAIDWSKLLACLKRYHQQGTAGLEIRSRRALSAFVRRSGAHTISSRVQVKSMVKWQQN